MIEQFIDNVLIIDDKPDEVQELINVLNKYDIYSSSYTPEEIKGQTIKNKQIIFCDLFLSKTDTTVPGNISELRNILKIICSKDFGSYGIVLWTNHKAHISDVKSKISTDKKIIHTLHHCLSSVWISRNIFKMVMISYLMI